MTTPPVGALPKYTLVERAGTETAETGSVWEPKIGYCRAKRKGNAITVSGTVGMNADKSFAPDAAAQSRRALAIIQGAIEALGGSLRDVVRTRIYMTNISEWERVAAVHGEVFRETRPATTMVQVAKLIDDAALVEIEADAIVG